MLTVPKLIVPNHRLVNAWKGLTRRLQTTVEAMRVTNGSGAGMSRGDVVYLTGNRTVALASTASAATAFALGVLVEDIPNGATGIVRTDNVAYARFVGAIAPAAGDRIWISATPGALTNAAPGTVDYSLGIISDASIYADPASLFCYVLLDRCCAPAQNIA